MVKTYLRRGKAMTRSLRAVPAIVATILSLLAAVPAAQAVILYWSADRATFEPHSCVYGGSGWQYQGQWSDYLGTPIAPNYFITAKHVGGSVGSAFTYNGQTYTTVASFPSSASDLQIWQVNTPFSAYAPLYTSSNEAGKTMTVFGRGTPRGSAVTVGGVTKGWTWGTSDHVQSWGSNKVDGVSDGGSGIGSLLRFGFDATGDYYEGSLSIGDSGGGVFIEDGATWKLAGINYGTDGFYSYTGGSDTGFLGSIFDQGGLYVGTAGNWTYVNDGVSNIPGSSYSSRISSNLSWIYSVIGQPPLALVPEPASLALLLPSAMVLMTRRRSAS
jgi:hypothetical protein